MCEYDDSSSEMGEALEPTEIPAEPETSDIDEIPEEAAEFGMPEDTGNSDTNVIPPEIPEDVSGTEAAEPAEPVEQIPEDTSESTDTAGESVRDKLHNIREEHPGESQGTDFRPNGQGAITR